jgi:hypothetical protein
MEAASHRPVLYLALWHGAQARARAQEMVGWGYDVRYDSLYSADELSSATRRLVGFGVAALVLSLDPMPGHTRNLALGLDSRHGLPDIPRIFVAGDAAQVKLTQQRLPRAVYTGWDGLREALASTLGSEPPPPDEHPPAEALAFL